MPSPDANGEVRTNSLARQCPFPVKVPSQLTSQPRHGVTSSLSREQRRATHTVLLLLSCCQHHAGTCRCDKARQSPGLAGSLGSASFPADSSCTAQQPQIHRPLGADGKQECFACLQLSAQATGDGNIKIPFTTPWLNPPGVCIPLLPLWGLGDRAQLPPNGSSFVHTVASSACRSST